MSLRMADGHRIIEEAQQQAPGNLMAIYVANYEDCIALLLNGSEKEYTARLAKMDARISALDQGPESSPWHRLCKAGIYLHRTLVNMRFGASYKAAIDFKHSYSLLRENQRLFPSFSYNQVFAGIEEAVVGSLPSGYRSIAAVLGIRGNIHHGVSMLSAFLQAHTSSDPLYEEALLYYQYARFYFQNEQQEVWNFVNSSSFNTGSLMHLFVNANIGLDFRKADEVFKSLSAAGHTPLLAELPVFDYQQAMALTYRLDTGATWYFRQYTDRTKSSNFIKDAWQKSAFVWYVNGNKAKAEACRARIKQAGVARLDVDKQAQRFAEAGQWPDARLLRVRLLTDGGYNARALAELNAIQPAQLNAEADRAEYYYRLGRVYQELAETGIPKEYTQPALANYRLAIQQGKDRHEQFAARAALQMGKMYEHLGMGPDAMRSYHECLGMPAHDFQNSIDQQAKAGINRIGGN